ncbi:Trifunctional nucleotide phosphoesterase protein [Schistosoma japonicum]|uniref:Trifunctional nucleotide phosphoesterase protein n=1 Tax=Schistosoma japonicum TaxID=6182 RepID=A0A4Z2DJI2_SCHJA|nr:Trifunctional nucleotide phosphoesterase protein [Schistosoma japonicum]
MNVNCLNILHFNDVYNVEDQKQEPIAGASRFTTALKEHGAGKGSIVLFSGDCLSPSLISNATHGRHIPPIMNKMFIECSLFGNHEFDFGMDTFQECIDMCNFSWINSNVYDGESNTLIGTDLTYKIIKHDDLNIGIIGLVEKEWIETIPCFTSSFIIVKDIVETGRELGHFLKTQQKCDLVIALTHMRWPNDRLLAENVPEIDLILGGHDHDYEYEWITLNENLLNDSNLLLDRTKISNKRLIVKSGSDYRMFSHLRVKYDKENCKIMNIDIEQVVIDGHWKPDEEVEQLVNQCTEKLESNLDRPLGRIEVDLDVRFTSVRLKETNIGNFICDVVLTAVDAECVLFNSGSLRADRIIKAGVFTLRDLTTILPFLDKLVVIEITGSQLIEALENSVSEYPKSEGRFPIIGGMRFTFNPLKPIGSRIIIKEVTVQNEPINMKRKYRLCLKHYLYSGNDGYHVFPQCPLLLDEEKCPILIILIQNYFRTVQVLKGFERSRTRHRQSLIPLTERQKLMPQLSSSKAEADDEKDATSRWNTARRLLIEEREKLSANLIAPIVDGRIKMITA